MQVFLEIDRRIEAATKLLALEEFHLERVKSAGLDQETAIDVVRNQRRHIKCLLAQRERVIEHQGVPRRGRKPTRGTMTV